jgi:hypothetical protein
VKRVPGILEKDGLTGLLVLFNLSLTVWPGKENLAARRRTSALPQASKPEEGAVLSLQNDALSLAVSSFALCKTCREIDHLILARYVSQQALRLSRPSG